MNIFGKKENISKEEILWKNYMIDINHIKDDENLNKLFPEIIQNLKENYENLSAEEILKLLEPVLKYKRIEEYKKRVFTHLYYEYNKLVHKRIEENYKINKIEIIPLCKRIYLGEYLKLKELYPEDILYLQNLYLPTYIEYMDKYLQENESNFTDISEFVKFIDKIKFYEGSLISDKHFNIINKALGYYGKEFYGDRLSGIVKDFRFTYNDFLKIKDDIIKEIEFLEKENIEDFKKKEIVIMIKNKYYSYLTVEEGQYIV